MKKVVQVTLSGHSATFQLDEDAGEALQAYLDRAKSRLGNDLDREEVLRDLEQSIAEKLARLPDTATRIVRRSEIDAVLEEIGAVDTGDVDPVAVEPDPDHRRRFYRIQQDSGLRASVQGLRPIPAFASVGCD